MLRLLKYLWMMVPFAGWFKKSETKVPEETYKKIFASTAKKPRKPKSPSKKVPAKKKSSAKKK